MNLADIRTDYRRSRLRRADLKDDPIEQFSHWLEEACDAGVTEPTAMSLATAWREGWNRRTGRALLLGRSC